MRWLPIYSSKTISSEKNGCLRIVTKFGKTAVIGDGVFQSGRYMQRVFRGMLRMLPRSFAPKKILVVGLGAGGCIPIIQKRFPGGHIIALEYDEVMIELAKQTYLLESEVGGVEIIRGDIKETLPRLRTEYDLVMVDVFCGKKVAPVLTSQEVLSELHRLLSWRGYMFVNLFKEREGVSGAIEGLFSLHKTRRVRFNEIGMYRHYGMGKMGEGVPAGFQDREQSRVYLEAIVPRNSRNQIFEGKGGLGARLSLGLFCIERFVQETQPDCGKTRQLRVISWQPYKGTNFPGWWRTPSIFTIHFKRGVAILEGTEYWKEWSSHARRHREKFLQDRDHEIAEVDIETFARAYHATKFLDPLTRRSFVSVLRFHLKKHPSHVHLTVVRRVSNGRILSGLATIDYPDVSQSDHVIAFIHPDAQNSSLGVGLIDDWHRHALRLGLKFLMFGLLRRSCDPRSWQGYTNFKRQFHLYEILYPRPVFRIVFPKKWCDIIGRVVCQRK